MKIVLLVLLLFSPIVIRADEPRAQFSFTSPNGRYEFRTLNQPQYRKWSLIETATKKVLYEVNGDFSSLTVLVGYDGKQLVMIDDFSESEPESNPEVLQFFLDGKKVKSYNLSELIENTQNVEQTVSHFMWLDKPFLIKKFAISDSKLTLMTIELNKFTFDIDTGEISEKKKAAEPEEKVKKNNSVQIEQKNSKLRFNGFYCEPNEDGRTCLRFYADGLVLAVALGSSVTDKDLAKKLPKWFRRDSENNVGKGKYSIRKNEITFTESAFYPENEGREVRVAYTGKIKGSGKILVLDTYSHYNGNRQKGRRFEFVRIEP